MKEAVELEKSRKEVQEKKKEAQEKETQEELKQLEKCAQECGGSNPGRDRSARQSGEEFARQTDKEYTRS
ncbi:MAG: hypothetical protein KKB21_00715 [Nanoarchaeota archaeon]|nr:hypothetical protein [Nanoarchaeota archaeon]